MCVVVLNGSFHPSSCCIDEVLPAHMAPVVLIHELARTVFNPNTTTYVNCSDPGLLNQQPQPAHVAKRQAGIFFGTIIIF